MTKRKLLPGRTALLTALMLAAFAALGFAQPSAEKAGGAPATTAAPAPVNNPADVGVLVASVYPGSPAEKAGIARGDIILAADGKDVNRVQELVRIVNGHKVGDSLALKLKHGDSERTPSVVLAGENGRPYIGIEPYVQLGPFSGMPMQGFGDERGNVPYARAAGALVASVVAGSPAEKAGLKQGDLIESMDGTVVGPRNDLSALVLAHKIGDTVTLSVRSQGQEPRDVKVTLDNNPNKADSPYLGIQYTWSRVGPMAGAGPMGGVMPFRSGPRDGNGSADASTLKTGVLVRTVSENGPAAKAGVQPRDLITAIDGVEVNSPRVVFDTVAKHKPGDTLSLTVYRFTDNKETQLTVTLGETPQVTAGTPAGAYLGITMGRYIGWEGPDFEGPMPMTPGPLNALPFGRLRVEESTPQGPGI